MLLTKAWVYKMFSTDSALLALIGATGHIVDAWAEKINTFPLVIIQDDTQMDAEFADNLPTVSKLRIRIDVFSKLDLVDTDDIGYEIARIMKMQYFTCGSNGEVQDPVEGVRHRVMRFSRELFTSDII